jgi:hypothetical protein
MVHDSRTLRHNKEGKPNHNSNILAHVWRASGLKGRPTLKGNARHCPIDPRNTGRQLTTEEQIERRVERMMDALDAQLMNGSLTQREYDSNVRDLNAWAEAKFAETNGRQPQ